MTKSEVRELILSDKRFGGKKFVVISYPDYNGGRTVGMSLMDMDEDPCETLGDFQYLEWEGDATDLLRNLKKSFWNYQEPRYEDPVEWESSMYELFREMLECI